VATPLTRLTYVTEGVLLNEAKNGNLSQYSCIIIDEAHERGLNTDLLLLYLKDFVAQYKTLKVIIMSATMNAYKFQSYFSSAELFHIPGKTHPVETYYLDRATCDYLLLACKVAKNIHLTEPAGDILIFLSGENEIEQACALLRSNTEGL
jgi:pre-mRNA-splicing factor ATP-dependent RNA helicase DHX15/PRP43